MTVFRVPLRFLYDDLTDVITIEGVKYSGDLFRAWAEDGMEVGATFRIYARGPENVLSIERLEEPMTQRDAR